MVCVRDGVCVCVITILLLVLLCRRLVGHASHLDCFAAVVAERLGTCVVGLGTTFVVAVVVVVFVATHNE